MLKSCAGLLMIPKECALQVNPWKDGAFFKFKAISQEASETESAKVHHYWLSMFVGDKDIKKWTDRIKPGQMFLLSNGSVSALIPEGKEYPIVEIRVSPSNLNYLKKAISVEE